MQTYNFNKLWISVDKYNYIKGLSFPSKFLVLNELVEHKRIHLGPDSSMACTSNEESLVRSEYRSDDERSYDLYLLDSTL